MPDFDVVIVGGGAAGIAAARRLSRSKLSTVLLEASSRLGGRAWTHEIAGLNLDLGCGWLHSAEKNAWVAIAKAAGVPIDESRAQWGIQYRNLGFPAAEHEEAGRAFGAWMERLPGIRASGDRAADALEPQNRWNPFIQAIVSFISGASLERLSATDYLAYDEASTESNWRTPIGLGALIAGSFPAGITLRPGTPMDSLALDAHGVTVSTPTGEIRARSAILAVSTAVLTNDSIQLPGELDPWREAAWLLPLGRNEKLFLEIVGEAPFERETQVLGNPHDARTASYYIRPLDLPVVECFLGGECADLLEQSGSSAAFVFALDQLSALFGAGIRRHLRPLLASGWTRSLRIGGAYSYALPGHAQARKALARPCDRRVFFAGEATHTDEFSTAHGAHDSGVRAANEVIAALT